MSVFIWQCDGRNSIYRNKDYNLTIDDTELKLYLYIFKGRSLGDGWRWALFGLHFENKIIPYLSTKCFVRNTDTVIGLQGWNKKTLSKEF